MPPLDAAALRPHIAALEELRSSRVLVLAASNLDLDLLPALYEQIRALGHCPRLDVVLHGRGGIVNAARRIALLLRGHAAHLAFIVPFHCQSSATLLTLCADEVIAGPLALFSPIDPQLNGQDGGAFSSLDIKQFGDMAQHWFGINAEEARTEALALLCNSMFPPTLTAFYRTTQELQQIGEELLSWQVSRQDLRQQIVRQLMSAYHSHNYALTREEMKDLGLCVRSHADAEGIAWEISKLLQAHIGGAQRDSDTEAWHDALLATRDGMQVRRRRPGGLAGIWQPSC